MRDDKDGTEITDERELKLKERELDIRERELALKQEEVHSRWRSPLFIGLVAAAVGLIGNLVVSAIQNRDSLKQERNRQEATLIMEALKGGDPERAADNLNLFYQLGFITDPRVRDYLARPAVDPPNLPCHQSVEKGESCTQVVVYEGLTGMTRASGAKLDAEVLLDGKYPQGSDAPLSDDGYAELHFQVPPGSKVWIQVTKKGYETLVTRRQTGTYIALRLSPVR